MDLPKLTYFDAAGRAWAIRACFNMAGIAFQDTFLTYADFKAVKVTFFFDATLRVIIIMLFSF